MDFLCLDFINSQFESEAVTGAPLMEQAWLHRFCHKWGLAEPKKNIEATLVQIRATLYQAVREYSRTNVIAAEKLSGLNEYLKSVLFYNVIASNDAKYRVLEVPQGSDNALFLYRIVMSFADLVSNYEANRLKICENPDCGWVFFDESKSRTRRWCGNTCASLIKVRRFRKKHLSA